MTQELPAQGKAGKERSLNITLILSGSIAAYKACNLISLLAKEGHTVQTMATKAALRFVGAASLEGLTGRKVYTSLWSPKESMTHIDLRRWSDLFLFYPATANRINQLSLGLAPDLLGATFLANNFTKPFWIAPAMNTGMLEHPATQEALRRLKAWGCRILHGDAGMLACGDTGAGRLIEPEAILALVKAEADRPACADTADRPACVDTADRQSDSSPDPSDQVHRQDGQVRQANKHNSVQWRRVLVTGGAMTEPIDRVRAITNTSSGRTATAVTAAFLARGWAVDYLHHETAALDGSEGARRLPYRTYEDFSTELDKLLKTSRYDAIVHAAAVSDYHVDAVEPEPDSGRTKSDDHRAPLPTVKNYPAAKLESTNAITLRLVPNPKILPRLREMAGNRPVVAGFKLTVGSDEDEGRRCAAVLMSTGAVDLVVWNDLQRLSHDHHDFILFGRPETASGNDVPILGWGRDNSTLAALLADRIEEAVNRHIPTSVTTRSIL